MSVLALFSAHSQAQPLRDYQCVIERMDALTLKGKALDSTRGYYVGKAFTVERATGVMAGILKNSSVTQPQVIDQGSSQKAFKAVTTMKKEQGLGIGSSLFSLVVNEYVQAAKKPFVFLENDHIFFGNCVHF